MFKDDIRKVRNSIIAIGFRPDSDKITIMGSSFAVSDDGKILSAAHLYNQLKPEQIKTLIGMVMTKRGENGLEHYTWLPLTLIKKEDKNDMVLFQLEDYKKTLLQPLELGDSEDVEIGEDAYFIGFPYAAQLINNGFGITLIVSKTIVSNIKRDGVNPDHPKNWFIVDAISNSGNSGAPLIDMRTNKAIGIMTVSFRTKSRTHPDIDIREPMHIAGARPINLAKEILE